jgi:flagellar protein FliO/FliZ
MMEKRRLILILAVGLFVFFVLPPLGFADGTTSGGYLSGYENADPKPTQVSWFSTLAYIVSLIAVFAFVVVMAYFASRFLSQKFGQHLSNGGGSILENLALGPNRSVCVVEMADRVFLLGVTEHTITLLSEINDAEEIKRLHRVSLQHESTSFLQDEGVFDNQLGALEQLAKRIPSIFKKDLFHR